MMVRVVTGPGKSLTPVASPNQNVTSLMLRKQTVHIPLTGTNPPDRHSERSDRSDEGAEEAQSRNRLSSETVFGERPIPRLRSWRSYLAPLTALGMTDKSVRLHR